MSELLEKWHEYREWVEIDPLSLSKLNFEHFMDWLELQKEEE